MFKQRLKERREKMGMTQAQLAQKAYCTQQLIGAFEVGTRTPSTELLSLLADVLECTTDYLLGRKSGTQDNR